MILGAMKSGTTSLYEMLIEHPEISPCRTKEPHYFCHDRTERYEDLWASDEGRHRYRLEASTSYTKYPRVIDVPERIGDYGLVPKFIYVVRNPIDRIESHYNFEVNNHGKKVRGFDESRLIECSMYFTQLQQFCRVFPDRSRYLILDFDRLISEPVEVVRACTDFLQLEPLDEISRRTSNRTATNLSDVWIRRTGRFKNDVGRLFSDTTRARIKQWLRSRTPSVKRRIGSEERARLQRILRRDIEQFGDTFDFDIHKWGF